MRSVSASGMPGIGVGPGLNGFLNSASLGIPGVLAPLGKGGTFAEMPGVFAGGVIGFVENPGGIFAGSILTSVFAAVFVLLLAVELATPPLPHPIANNTKMNKNKTNKFLNIISVLGLNIAVPV